MVKTRYDKKAVRDALIKNDYSIKQTAIDIKEKAANLRMYISRNKDYMYEFKEE